MVIELSTLNTIYAEAWDLCNASFHEDGGYIYREAGHALYDSAIQYQVRALFARSDEQNARLDAILLSGAGAQPGALLFND